MPIAAISMVALAGLVGGGVDMSRAYMVQNRLQNACDAGVLAGRRAVSSNGFDDAAEEQANAYFDTNFDEDNEDVSDTSFAPTSSDRGNTVTGTAGTTIDTVVMRLFGFDEIPLSVTCSASMSIGNSDVMMVLDVTGSMACTSGMTNSQCTNYVGNFGYSETAHGGDSRMKELRGAMKGFYDTVKNATAASNARVRYGFVPYSSSVNVGKLLYDEDPSNLVDSWTYQSREPQYKVTEKQIFSGWGDPVYTEETGYSDTSYSSWGLHSTTKYKDEKACRNAKPADGSWSNSGNSSTSTETEINQRGQRVTTTTTTQRQTQRVYACAEMGEKKDKGWYVVRSTAERNYYEADIATQDPEYTIERTSVFDHFKYKALTYNTAAYKAGSGVSVPVGTNGAGILSTWQGCVEERETVAQATFSWNSILGYDPEEAYDLQIDMPADSGDPETQWRPMWPEVSYYRTTSSSGQYLSSSSVSDYGRKSQAFCPRAAALFAPMNESAFDSYADSLFPSGATYHNLGMVWGARLSSPQGIFADNVTDPPSNGGAVARHVIFMTDGEMAPSHTTQSSYGIEWHDRRVTSDGYSGHASRHTQRFLAACAATKAKGIRVWVIAFSSALTSDLTQCASTDSSFLAVNSSQLNAAFQEIAKNVGELRITQ